MRLGNTRFNINHISFPFVVIKIPLSFSCIFSRTYHIELKLQDVSNSFTKGCSVYGSPLETPLLTRAIVALKSNKWEMNLLIVKEYNFCYLCDNDNVTQHQKKLVLRQANVDSLGVI
jgi:hypothetical protein